MERQEILDLINRNPAFFLATVDKREPRVRGMLLYRADDRGIVFHTGSFKEVHRQLLSNPDVELCFNDMQRMIQVRVRGKAVLVDDPAFKEEIVNAPGREFLKPWVSEHGTGMLSVFRVVECRALVWTLATNFSPPRLIPLYSEEG